MSSYIKLIIFIVVLLLISVAIVFIDSSMDNINQSMPEISKGIVQGDEDYNESVELLNSRRPNLREITITKACINWKGYRISMTRT